MELLGAWRFELLGGSVINGAYAVYFHSELMYIALFPGSVVLCPPQMAHYASRWQSGTTWPRGKKEEHQETRRGRPR